jgi:acyl-phosphate glycerol 3-phosphate acyltransferase
MVGTIALDSLVVVIAYLLGSIPSAYLMGWLLKRIDMREVGDGRMGMATTYRRVGLLGGLMVGLLDSIKGIATVLLAQKLGFHLSIVLLAGLAAVVGHNWSIFLRFQGGKGALTTYGVLFALGLIYWAYWQFIIAVSIAAILTLITLFTRKTGLATGIIFVFLALLNLFTITDNRIWLSVFPIIISLPMVLKHISMLRAGTVVMPTIENLGSKEETSLP